MSTESNAVRFLNAYASIENSLERLNNETRYVSFSQLLGRVSRTNKIVSLHEQDLREYSELRNAIVHERGKKNEIIAEPCDSVTEDIERIAAILNQKTELLTFASSPVKVVHPDTPVREVFTLMKKMGTSKIPVYDERKYIGVITVEEIAEWALGDQKEEYVSSALSIQCNERVLFLSRKSSVESVSRAFENAMNKGLTLLAIIITEKGSVKEKPLGIITLADLPKILKSFS